MEKSPKSLITAIVLAGGQSSRMGRDKALIEIRGVPLLKRICLLARECALEVYVVTPWIERYESILPKDCLMIREVFAEGETIPHGPLMGFAQGLVHVKTEWVLLLACDLPYLTFWEVKKWSELLETTPEDVIALLPKQQHRWEPLCGFYRRRCLDLLQEFIPQGGRSFQRWLNQYSVQELPISHPKFLFNCNTPEDLKKVKL